MKEIKARFLLAISSIYLFASLIAMEDCGDNNLVDVTVVKSFIRQGNLEAFQSCNLTQFGYDTIQELRQKISRQFQALGLAKQLCEHSALFNQTIATLEKTAEENAKLQPFYRRTDHGYRFIESALGQVQSAAKGTVLGIIKEAGPFTLYYDDLVAVMKRIEQKEDKKTYVEMLLYNAKVMEKKIEQEFHTYEIIWFPSGDGYTVRKK